MIARTVDGIVSADPALLRRQALLSALAALFTALLYFVADFPHTREIARISLGAAFGYALFYAFFDRVHSRNAKLAVALLSGMAVIMLAFIVHYSGGIASPFIFLYFCILISEAVYGLENPFTLPLAIGTYSAVCIGECAGLLEPANPWTAAVCANKVFAAVLIGTTILFMWITRYITGLILANLRGSLERENRDKESLLKKFSELDSTAQIGALAHRIAHDLRAPLSSISGYIQLEMAKHQSKDSREVFTNLNDIVNRMSESLTCITRFGKVSEVPAEPIHLPEFFRQLLAIAAFSPQALGVRFVRNYPETIDATVRASRSDLQQAYFNIVKNAIEAMQDNSDGKRLEVSITLDGKEVEITVADNGPGMPPEQLRNLFRKSITTKKDGTGVGLVITRDLLLRHDGTMELHNRAEGGLRVVTRLPRAGGTLP